MKIDPIRPDECENKELPEFVLIGANNCINKHYHNGTSHFLQDDLIDEILNVAPDYVTRNMLFDKHWLDIEETYRKVGWKVNYDSPAYCETYKANFTFSRPSKLKDGLMVEWLTRGTLTNQIRSLFPHN